MRWAVLLCLLAFAACQSAARESGPGPIHAEPPPPITASPPTASPPSATPPPTTGTDTPPAMAPPLLPPRAAASPQAAPAAPNCQKDSDCALTYVAEESCCPTLCAPRAVTVAEARRREEMVQQCEQKRGHPCPVPACRARAFEAACTAGTCTARLADDR